MFVGVDLLANRRLQNASAVLIGRNRPREYLIQVYGADATVVAVMLSAHSLGINMIHHKDLRENITLSTKPEVHNTSLHCQRKIKPRLQSTCMKVLVKFAM